MSELFKEFNFFCIWFYPNFLLKLSEAFPINLADSIDFAAIRGLISSK